MTFYAGGRLTGVAPPSAPAPLFRSDFRSAAAPNFGFSGFFNVRDGLSYNRTLLSTGGPQGQGAIEYAWLVEAPGSNQVTWGFNKTGLALPTYGQSLFVRFKKWMGPGFYGGDDDGVGEVWGGKVVIFSADALVGGPEDGTDARPMVLMAPRTTLADQSIRASRNISGPTAGATPYQDVTSILIGGWIRYQAEWKISSNSSAADGYIKQWITADPGVHVYGSPTGVSDLNMRLNPPTGEFDFGFFHAYLRLNGVCTVRYCDVEVDNVFASTW